MHRSRKFVIGTIVNRLEFNIFSTLKFQSESFCIRFLPAVLQINCILILVCSFTFAKQDTSRRHAPKRNLQQQFAKISALTKKGARRVVPDAGGRGKVFWVKELCTLMDFLLKRKSPFYF
jgi:hypothetical protein